MGSFFPFANVMKILKIVGGNCNTKVCNLVPHIDKLIEGKGWRAVA